MATFKIYGLVELQSEIARIAEMDNGKLAKQMLKAGSKEVINEWKKVAEERHNKHTGHMKRETNTTNPKKNKYGRFTLTYPMGKEARVRHGVVIQMRDAAKAFYQHYGYRNPWLGGRFVPGDRWVDIVEMRAAPKAEKAMQAVWDDYLKKTSK